MRGNDGLNVNALVALTESIVAAGLRGGNRKGSGKRREGGSKGKGKGEHEGDGNQTSRGVQWPCHRNCRDFHGKPLENNIGRRVCRKCGVARPKHFAPGTLSREEKDWTKRKEDVEDYVQSVPPCTRELLRYVAKAKTEMIDETVKKEGYVLEEWRQQTALFTLFKPRTLDEARNLVLAAERGNGYESAGFCT